MENRGVPQDFEVGLQGRGVKAAHGGPTGQSYRRILRRKLAHLLDDDGTSSRATSTGRNRIDAP